MVSHHRENVLPRCLEDASVFSSRVVVQLTERDEVLHAILDHGFEVDQITRGAAIGFGEGRVCSTVLNAPLVTSDGEAVNESFHLRMCFGFADGRICKRNKAFWEREEN